MKGCAGFLVIVAVACGPSTDEEDPSLEELCVDFSPPAHDEDDACADVDLEDPAALVACVRGSGDAGQWNVDADGLPRYDLAVEHRCDPAGYVESPVSGERLAPVHLVGNGRGVVAVAQASGAVELYSQDRGPKWLNKIDQWKDPEDDDYPMQVGGGFSYLVVDGEVRSTRFDDLEVGVAAERQARRFGVGYVETVTKFDDLLVTRRVFAPDVETRAVVAEVTIENLTDQYKEVGLVELWDVNVHQVSADPSGLADPDAWAAAERSRRSSMAGFEQTVSYSDDDKVALVETTARSLPEGVSGRDDVSELDWFVDPIFLASIDAAETPDAVWLSDGELWSAPRSRRPPAALSDDGNASNREETIDGAEQRALLAIRIPVQVPVEAPVVRRFAFGYVPEGRSLQDDLAALRDAFGELAQNAADAWRERLVYLAVPEAPAAGALQREVAWASYAVQAGAVYDEYFGARAVGPGGADRYLAGVEGAPADLALLAESLLWIDPVLARDTLQHALSTQHGKEDDTPYLLPAGWGGVGTNPGEAGDRRTDSYYLLPAAVGRYAATTRDFDFLDQDTPYWPRASGASGSVIDHLTGALEYASEDLGTGGRGFVSMGMSDGADASSAPGGEGASSLYNAGAVVAGFPLLADVVESRDGALASAYRDLVDEQSALLSEEGWSGQYYYRGFDDGGQPLEGDEVFLEPQLFPILARAVDAARRDQLLDLIGEVLETPTGAVGSAPADGTASSGARAIRPAANAWLTQAYGMRDPDEGWDSLWRNTLAAHAEAYPEGWVGIWTGPAAFSGPGAEDPGAPDARLLPGAGHVPALSAHGHAGTLRAVMGLLGIEGGADRLRVAPRVPGETFSVVSPRVELTGSPNALVGAFVPSGGGSVEVAVTLPSGLRTGEITVMVEGEEVAWTRDGDVVSFDLPLKKNSRVTWSVTR